jgi:murein DD-endopeptidase MepM/ murein hydrolase activator NlpD
LCLGVLDPASAEDERRKKRAVDSAITDLRHELLETTRELRNAALALRGAEAKLPGAHAAVARVRGQLAAAQARDRALARKLRTAEEEVRRSRRSIRAAQQKIESTRSLIGRIARSSYQQGSYAELAVVLEADTPGDLASRLVLLQNAMRSQGGLLDDLSEQRADLAAQRATQEEKRAELAEVKAEQERSVVRIRALEQRAVVARQTVQDLIKARAGAVAVIEREKAAEERRYRAMQKESRRLQRILVERARKARAAAQAARARRLALGRAAQSSGGALVWPANGGVTSSYGMRVHPVTGIYKLHDGADFGTGCGAAVHAAASGTVIQTTNVVGYGNQLVIDHGVIREAHLATSYSHLSGFAASPGQNVLRGQVIGYSGGGEGMSGAGFSTGCHLHFMVYVNGGTTNPLGWL